MRAATAVLGGPAGWRFGVGAGALSGALVALSLPPFGWWPLGWIGLAVLAAALPGRPWKQRLATGAAFGVVDYVIGLLWVQEFSVPGYVAVVVVSALYALLAVALVPTARRGWVAVGLPCTFVLADWARDRFPLGGLPLAGLALGQASGPLAPVLRLGGSLALVAETVLIGVALAAVARLVWVLARRRQNGPGDTLGPVAALAVAVVAVAVVLPVAGAISPSGAGGHLPPIRIGLVQGGGPRGTRAVNTDPQVVFDRHLAEASQLAGPLDLVVWPEGVLQSHQPYTSSVDAAEVSRLAAQHRAAFLVGVEQDVGANRYLNEVVVWNRRGDVVGRYVKNHLVPFGEYVPFRALIKQLFNITDVPLDAIPGHQPGFVRTPAGPVAVMISYEVFFDERARGGVRAGGQLLVVPTNTASYRSTQVPTQEVAADRMRAWETGRWLVQVTPTGYTTVVSPTGAVTRKSHLDAASVVEATVARRTGMTVYDHIGDPVVALLALAGWLAVAGTALANRDLANRAVRRRALAGLPGRRRGRRPASSPAQPVEESPPHTSGISVNSRRLDP
ncbi:MAG TPA: apolipoprotein N-acyltransferase [Acidimicrobiales bacterium]|nr:apolipoprotein N-acyltransferase [Acidimicrobiales bacterium]